MPNMGIAKKSPATKAALNTSKTLAPKKDAVSALSAQEANAVYRVNAPPTARPTSGLADALFTTTQQRVLGLLYGLPDRSFFANEIITLSGSGSGAVQRELARMESSGLTTARWIGNQKHYQANKQSPIFADLWNIVQKTVGLAGPLYDALRPLESQIRAAFVFGSVAKKQDSTGSDIDLMVISDSLSYADLFAALEAVTARLGRKVNPTVLSEKDLAKKSKAGSAFFERVLSQPKIWLIGSESGLGV